MAIRHKRKNSTGYAWQTGDLVEGQIGLNIADGTLHFDKADGSTVTIASGGISNVVDDSTPQLGGNLDVQANSITTSVTNGNLVLEPNGTGEVKLGGTNIKLGNSGNTGNTSVGTPGGNLRLVGQISETGGAEIVLNGGANANINMTPKGSGFTFHTGLMIVTVSSTAANNPALQARNQVTFDNSEDRPSFLLQKGRSNKTLADMTNEPVVMNFGVRDSAFTNRTFGRWIGRYNGPSTNPNFTLRGSPDDFTTNLHYMTIGGGVALFGSNDFNYTITSNTGGNLILTANNNTTSGTITIESGADGDISIAPNGTGKILLESNVINIEESKTPASATAAGEAGDIAWDADYIYVCTATDTWKRTAISTWA